MAEGIPGTVTHQPADGGRARRRGTVAGVAISQQRLAIYGLGEPLVDVIWDGGDARELDLAADERGLTVAFDAARFGGDGATGRVEILLRIADAPALVAAIEQRRRPLPPRRRRDAAG